MRKSVHRRACILRSPRLRLSIEPLEARRLLAGLSVSVYVDHDGSRSFDAANDAVAPNRLLFVDLNENGRFDASEPLAVTDQSGTAFFQDLSEGDYSVGLITNPNSQRQADPVSVGAIQQVDSLPAAELFADLELRHRWILGPAGTLQSLTLDGSPTIALGGALVASAQPSSNLIQMVIDRPDGHQEVLQLELSTGDSTRTLLSGLIDGNRVTAIAATSTDTLAVVEGNFGSTFVRLDQLTDRPHLMQASGIAPVALAGSTESDHIVVLSQHDDATSMLWLLNAGSDFAVLDYQSIDGLADEVTLSSAGDLAFVSLVEGGLVALRIGDGNLSTVALLEEAGGPVAAQSRDGRIVTGSRLDPRELIVWNEHSWSPIARRTLPVDTTAAAARRAIADERGDQVLVGHPQGVFALDLALASMPRVTIDPLLPNSELKFGVRTTGVNHAPDVSGVATREMLEDGIDEFDLGTVAGIEDDDGDFLVYSLLSQAKHGTIELAAMGGLKYRPKADYYGPDSASLLVHDGMTATELVIHWNVLPVNDPPASILVEISPQLESIPAGTQVGFVTVFDVDLDASYRVTTSDPRFVVNNGQLIFVGGELDYEAGSTVEIEIRAIDEQDASLSIGTIASLQLINVIEPPGGVRLTGRTVPENSTGHTVGILEVIDPDAGGEYGFSVSDPRFSVVEGALVYAADTPLNYESESEIELVIHVIDQDSNQRSSTVTIEVLDRNDPPTGIILSRMQIEEFTFGAVAGELAVVDEDGDVYEYSVSDPRFEVVGGTLKLRDDEQVVRHADGELIAVTVVATASNGDRVEASLELEIAAPTSAYHNSEMPQDVNGDGVVSPLDALLIINELNEHGPHPVPHIGSGGEPPSAMYDVNDDGFISPLDVLLIISRLNEDAVIIDSPEGEGESADVSEDTARQVVSIRNAVNLQRADARTRHGSGFGEEGVSQIATPSIDQELERRRRENSSLDAELELLLDELSRERLT